MVLDESLLIFYKEFTVFLKEKQKEDPTFFFSFQQYTIKPLSHSYNGLKLSINTYGKQLKDIFIFFMNGSYCIQEESILPFSDYKSFVTHITFQIEKEERIAKLNSLYEVPSFHFSKQSELLFSIFNYHLCRMPSQDFLKIIHNALLQQFQPKELEICFSKNITPISNMYSRTFLSYHFVIFLIEEHYFFAQTTKSSLQVMHQENLYHAIETFQKHANELLQKEIDRVHDYF